MLLNEVITSATEILEGCTIDLVTRDSLHIQKDFALTGGLEVTMFKIPGNNRICYLSI